MALAPGTRLGVYEVTALIGEGGMGQVYRAHDTKLNRDVALKVLPDSFASDPDRLARFTREAQTLASLNHPNIAHIHGLEESGGVRALVMELVEGETLDERIWRPEGLRLPSDGSGRPSGLPIDEALPIARQIAEALEAAHEQGIIHRDLKPANIKVRSDGTVKVLDFGLAKAMDAAPGSLPNMSMSPTITSPVMVTGAGMILGTAAYMSPEQARGKNVDKRSDIWAFGCVLYEMLTGARAFGGDDVQDTFVAIMRDEPDWTRLPATLSPALGTYIRRCLHKNPKQRIADVQDIRLALEGAFETAAPQTVASAGPAAPRGRLAWMTALAWVAVVATLVLAIPALRHLRETPPPATPETRTEIVTPATEHPTDFALSPDGQRIVYVATGDGVSRLWLRALAATTAQPLAGTEEAGAPFWSPDGRSIGFFAADALKRLDLDRGAPQILTPARNGSGGTWNADGVIVFSPAAASGLMRVPAAGGASATVTTLGAKQVGHVYPEFLPDGRRFLYYATGVADAAGIYLGGLDKSAATRLTVADGSGVYLPSGWLLWRQADKLFAQRLDTVQATLIGDPVVLSDDVTEGSGRTAVSVAATGLIAYRTGIGSQNQLTWFDRSGTRLGVVGKPDTYLREPRLSPDDKQVVVSREVQGNQDLWLLDDTRETRFTFDAGNERNPVWSPDGARIVYRSAVDLYQRTINGTGADEPIVRSEQLKVPTSWSSDGRFLLYQSLLEPQADADLWVMPTGGDRKPFAWLKTPFRETDGTFSPDGRWITYTSNESGRFEVYVRPFLEGSLSAGGSGGQRQVSTTGGMHPTWRRDGRELYYVNSEGTMLAAPVKVNGAAIELGIPIELFRTRIVGGGVEAVGRHYDIARDGRFLIDTFVDGPATPITLLQNWNPEAKK